MTDHRHPAEFREFSDPHKKGSEDPLDRLERLVDELRRQADRPRPRPGALARVLARRD